MIDLDSLFGQAKEAVSKGMSDVLEQGGNAALGFLEQKAIDIIEQDKAQREKQLQTFTTQNMSGPPAPGSFGAYIGNVLQSPVLKEMGPSIMIGVAIIAVGAIFISSK